jgi:SAM-dependent methyltransferase
VSRFGGYDDQPFLAELYDLVPQYSARRDLEFYVDLCRSAGGPVLELGCGTGRVLIPAATAGTEITGLDASPRMLAKCKQNLSGQPAEVTRRVHLTQADMTTFNLDRTFKLVIMPFRPFQHLIAVEDQLACLTCVNAHLEVGGRLVFDMFQVDLNMISDPGMMQETEDLAEFDLPDGRRLRRCHRFAATHRAEQYNDIEIIYYVTDTDGTTERLVQAFPLRYFFRYEVEHMLTLSGFHVVDVFGDFDRTPLSDASPEMIFVAEKAHSA